MNENDKVQDAQVVEKPAVHKDTLALEALRTQVKDAREDFKRQLATVKDGIETREEELKNLNIRKLKLQGAIEASDIYLKAAVPSSK